MNKLEEIKAKILERIENRDFELKTEQNAYLVGYLNALLDIYEINSDEYFELLEEMKYD